MRKAFRTHQEAIGWIRAEDERLHPDEAAAEEAGFSRHQIAEFRVALAKLGDRASLIDAVDFWLKHAAPVEDAPTVREAISKLHLEQQKQDLSERHIRETKAKLTRLFRGLGDRKISELTRLDLGHARDAKDATGKDPSAAQRVKRIRYASILITWAAEKGWIQPERSPLRGVSKPRLRAQKISILTPEEVAHLLKAALEILPEIVPALAIKLFCGIRNSELYPLTWNTIKPVTIRLEKTKTDKARSVSIPDPLRSWLPKEQKEGFIFSCKHLVKDRESVWLEAMDLLQEKARIQLPQNVLRHTFGSYHYAREKDAGKTAFEMGNSPAVVLRCYADAVDDLDCARFWLLTKPFVSRITTGRPICWPEAEVERILHAIAGQKKDDPGLGWSKQTPKAHASMYSVEETVSDRAIFAFLVDPGDGSQGDIVSVEEWEEGSLSTKRARLNLLRNFGFVA